MEAMLIDFSAAARVSGAGRLLAQEEARLQVSVLTASQIALGNSRASLRGCSAFCCQDVHAAKGSTDCSRSRQNAGGARSASLLLKTASGGPTRVAVTSGAVRRQNAVRASYPPGPRQIPARCGVDLSTARAPDREKSLVAHGVSAWGGTGP